MNNTWIIPAVLLFMAVFTGCASLPEEPAPDTIYKAAYRAGVSVHDPSIAKDTDGTYYIFGSHMEAAKTTDLKKWESVASGVNKYNPLFDNLFTDYKAFDYVGRNTEGGYSVWAPDVIYNKKTGKWMMYFCTTSSYIKSNICFGISDSVDGPYTYQDTIIYSGFTSRTLEETNVEQIIGDENPRQYLNGSRYNNMQWPNAIDPALFYDEDDRLWMSYGSWSGGIFILEIDQDTGYPIHPKTEEATRTDSYFGRHLAGGGHNSIEGPYIIYDEESGYYYMFVSYGSLVSEGGYQMRLYRSEHPDGPYTDTQDQELELVVYHKDYGIKLMGNYSVPSLLTAYMAPGHNSALIDDNGEILVTNHVRFDDGTERHEPRINKAYRTENGWLAVSPFPAWTEPEKDFRTKDIPVETIQGYYYMINHGTDINGTINKPTGIILTKKGEVVNPEGEEIGTWVKRDQNYFDISVNGTSFSGIINTGQDEAGNRVCFFTTVSNTNESIWGIQYNP